MSTEFAPVLQFVNLKPSVELATQVFQLAGMRNVGEGLIGKILETVETAGPLQTDESLLAVGGVGQIFAERMDRALRLAGAVSSDNPNQLAEDFVTAIKNGEVPCLKGVNHVPQGDILIGACILEGARILAGSISGSVLLAGAGASEGVALVSSSTALTDTPDTGVTLQCGKSASLFSQKTRTETESDLPFGKGAAGIKQDAIDGAEDNATDAVEADLKRQIGLYSCPSNCNLKIGKISTEIVSPGKITKTKLGRLGFYDDYTATATASGKVTVECTKPS
ncbi:MAG: hypothetical protein O7E52_23175 [Candidatus Poribacteria bacterium]|nr:hypothetical protein [Candidatus Poribacteria bacterium]